MGDIIYLWVVMLIVAVAAFAPLGYFILVFSKGSGEDLGKTDPKDHSVENAKYYHIINDVMGKIFGK
ncbi:MAG: hypothetical protein KAJ63_02495 [Methyloprofundus sp.]|nr:hypothetical protein [Methyloprofundus sp.]